MGPSGDRPIRIDAHVHFGLWRQFAIPGGGGINAVIDEMDLLGIDKACVVHHLAFTADRAAGNHETARAVQDHPDRLIGYASVDITRSDGVVHELRRSFDDLGLRGVKMYDHSGYVGYGDTQYPLLHPANRIVYDFCAERSAPILFHSHHSPEEWRELTRAYPEVNFLWAHAGALHVANHAREHLVATLAGTPNLYWDLTSSRRWGTTEFLIDRVGASHVVFGSDMGHIDARAAVGRLRYSDIADASLALVLGQNAARLFGIPDLMPAPESPEGSGDRDR